MAEAAGFRLGYVYGMRRRDFLTAGLGSLAQPGPSRRYRAAIIGHTGRGGYGHEWETAWKGFPSIEVVAVADPDDAGRGRAMARSGAARGYRDYLEMLRKEKPDLVGIFPRWLDQRLAMVTAAAEAGAHILIEKPFAQGLPEADALVAVAERHGIKVQVGHTARPTPVTRRAYEMVRAGEIGVLLEMRARGKEDARAGGEDLIVLGTHDFDLMRMFAGDPKWVFAHVTEKGEEVDPRRARQPTEPVGPVAGDEVAAMFCFPGGVHGYFGSKASDQRSGVRFGLTLYGSKGAIFIPLTAVPSEPPYLLRSPSWVSDSGAAWERINAPGPKTRADANAMMVADLLEAIEKDRDPVCSARDGRWTIEMVTGIYQSQLSGARVEFPLKNRG